MVVENRIGIQRPQIFWLIRGLIHAQEDIDGHLLLCICKRVAVVPSDGVKDVSRVRRPG